MAKPKIGSKDILIGISPMLIYAFYLLMAWLWAKRGDWSTAMFFLISSVIWPMFSFALLMSIVLGKKLDNRFDKLEEILNQNRENDEEK